MEVTRSDQSDDAARIEASADTKGGGSETPLVLYGEAASISHALGPGDRLLIYCPMVRSEHQQGPGSIHTNRDLGPSTLIGHSGGCPVLLEGETPYDLGGLKWRDGALDKATRIPSSDDHLFAMHSLFIPHLAFLNLSR